MILAAILVLAAFASAQTNDARALLQEIAASARSTTVWRAEGVEIQDITGNGIQVHGEVDFKIAVQGPSKMRWETSGDDDTLMVCDGTYHWSYYRHGISFYRNPVGVSPCQPALGDFSGLADNLMSAIVIGSDRSQFAGGPRECNVVRARYASPVSPDGTTAGSTMRTLCIDVAEKLVLRDSVESTGPGMHSGGTVTYSVYERHPSLSSEIFQIALPTGTFKDEGPLLGGDDPAVQDGVYRIGSGVTMPTLISKVDASYTPQARQAGVSGLALVSLIVDSNGVPQNISVVGGLGHGLDEKAIEAVGQWRFHPGTIGGVPVSVGILTAVVNFRLP